MTKIRLKL